jgi:CheY-like chemotaxis protein
VAYIEDEAEMIDLVRLILGRQGFSVLGANGGKDGVDLILKEKPELILLDLMMPDMDGWEVYHQIKSDDDTRNIPVIVISAKELNRDEARALQESVSTVMQKQGFEASRLIQEINTVVGRQ